MKNIILYIMGYKGLTCLQSVIENHNAKFIVAVISAQDKTVQNDYYNEISELCKKNDIQFYDRNDNHSIYFDIALAISWKWIIPIPNEKQLIVFHDSILPRYRGFAPLVGCLINGESKIGVTALFATDEYDKGDIIAQSVISIDYPIKIGDAIEKITSCYIELLNKIIDSIKSGEKIISYPQNESNATYSLWLDEKDYLIRWNKSASEIKRFIDSVGYPYKGALSFISGQKVRILESSEFIDIKIENRISGKIIFLKDNHPIVVCGKGLLKIEKIIDAATKQDLFPLKYFRTRFEESPWNI